MSLEIHKPELERRMLEEIFRNTRMPVAVVFENLEDGVTIDELVELYAGLTPDQIKSVLDFAARSLVEPMEPAGY